MSGLAFVVLSLRWLMVPLAITICCMGNPSAMQPDSPNNPVAIDAS